MKISARTVLFILFSLTLFASMASRILLLIDYASDWDNTNASQVFLIPFVTGALLYLSRDKVFESVRYAVLPGALVLGFGALILGSQRSFASTLAFSDQLSWSTTALVTLWLGGFLLFFGIESFKRGAFPLLFLIFAIPVPSPIMDRAILVLQHASASTAFFVLKLTGMPIYRDGVIFTLPNIVIEVAPQCSGIRSGISLLILTLLAGHLLLRSYWKRGALLLVAIPILIFKNALRISMLSLLAVYVDPGILATRIHKEGGIPFFVVGLLLLYPVLSLFMKSEKSEKRIVGHSMPQGAKL